MSCQFMLEKEPSGLEKDSSELEQDRNDGHQFMSDADSVPFINLEFDEEEEDAAHGCPENMDQARHSLHQS